jgi:hypothetical protein
MGRCMDADGRSGGTFKGHGRYAHCGGTSSSCTCQLKYAQHRHPQACLCVYVSVCVRSARTFLRYSCMSSSLSRAEGTCGTANVQVADVLGQNGEASVGLSWCGSCRVVPCGVTCRVSCYILDPGNMNDCNWRGTRAWCLAAVIALAFS